MIYLVLLFLTLLAGSSMDTEDTTWNNEGAFQHHLHLGLE